MKTALLFLVGILAWVQAATTARASASTVTGRLDVIYDVWSKELKNSRPVRVWLPPDYESQTTKRYPVIYFHDGQNGFDDYDAGGASEWHLDEVMTELIGDGRTQPAIIVGIDSSDDRFAEYDYTLKGKRYADFVVGTVKPLIDRSYRTKKDRNSTFTLGSSMGAHISMALLWKHAEVFSGAAGLSIPPNLNADSLFKIIASSPVPTEPVKLYMDVGTKGLDARFLTSTRRFHAALVQAGLPATMIDYRVFQDADHIEPDWAKRVHIPLIGMLDRFKSERKPLPTQLAP